jgi:hypothetical protein
MKKIVFTYLTVSLFAFCAVSAQTESTKNSPVGKWKFEAPAAPEGYNSGRISISFAGNKYSASISMVGSDYAIPGDKTVVKNDTVTFTVFLEGTEIAISLKTESDTKMTGKAVYIEGEVPLMLTKELPEK